MPDAHALLSPSASHRWLHCTPCVLLEAKIPSKDTVFTREGTLAHEIGELCLKEYLGVIPDRPLFEIRGDIEAEGFDWNETYTYVREGYVDKVIAEFEAVRETDPEAMLLVESKVRMAPYAEECWGTSDAIIIGNATIHVCDYKHGKGVRVDAPENPQMMLYALGAYQEFGSWLYEVRHVQMSIYQPRLHHWSTGTMEIEDLLGWAEEVVRPQSAKALRGEGEFRPGTWCRFCRCAPQCMALAGFCIDTAENSFDPKLMTPDEIGTALEKLPVVEAWCGTISDYALHAITEEGKTIPGWKVVEGVSRAKITDQEGAVKALRERGFNDSEIYAPQTLNGITALKKLLGKKAYDSILTPFITRAPGKPAVVPESDPRPALNGIAPDKIFGNLDI